MFHRQVLPLICQSHNLTCCFHTPMKLRPTFEELNSVFLLNGKTCCHLHLMWFQNLRPRVIETRPTAWKAAMIPLHQRRYKETRRRFELRNPKDSDLNRTHLTSLCYLAKIKPARRIEFRT